MKWQFEVPYGLSDKDEGDWANMERDMWNMVRRAQFLFFSSCAPLT